MRLKSGSNQPRFLLSGGFVKPYAVIAGPSASWGNRNAHLRQLRIPASSELDLPSARNLPTFGPITDPPLRAPIDPSILETSGPRARYR